MKFALAAATFVLFAVPALAVDPLINVSTDLGTIGLTGPPAITYKIFPKGQATFDPAVGPCTVQYTVWEKDAAGNIVSGPNGPTNADITSTGRGSLDWKHNYFPIPPGRKVDIVAKLYDKNGNHIKTGSLVGAPVP